MAKYQEYWSGKEEEYAQQYEYNETDEQLWSVILWFRKQDEKTRQSWTNWGAEKRTGEPYIHVEIFFLENAVTFTVDLRKPVTMIEGGNDYTDSKKWEGVRVFLTEREYNDMFTFCEKELGKPFDKSGIYFFDFKFCCTTPIEDEAWICSRLITKAFIVSGVFDVTVDYKTITPPKLRKLAWNLEREGRVVQDASYFHRQ